MSLGLLGKKLGVTHVYDEFGRRITVTAVQAGPCTIVAKREPAKHGYHAVQLGFEPVDEKKLTKPRLGLFKKAGTAAFRYIKEFRLPAPPAGGAGPSPKAKEAEAQPELKVGQELTLSMFQEYELVDVGGISIGKGFQGGMKRWNWKGGRETHGSMQHRAPGSIGSTTTPGRVIKGHHLPGHMGNALVSIQNLKIIKIDAENHLVLVAGSVPGPENELVWIRKSSKKAGVIKKPQVVQVVVDEDEEEAKKAKAKKK